MTKILLIAAALLALTQFPISANAADEAPASTTDGAAMAPAEGEAAPAGDASDAAKEPADAEEGATEDSKEEHKEE